MHQTGQISDVTTLADRLAIYDVLVRHSRGVDRGDAAILTSAYWPQAEVGNVAIEIDGVDARVETHVVARHYIADVTAGDRAVTAVGRYLDRMQRRGDVWKIAHRRVVMDWNQHALASAKWEGAPFEGLAWGTRDITDPVYLHLGG